MSTKQALRELTVARSRVRLVRLGLVGSALLTSGLIAGLVVSLIAVDRQLVAQQGVHIWGPLAGGFLILAVIAFCVTGGIAEDLLKALRRRRERQWDYEDALEESIK